MPTHPLPPIAVDAGAEYRAGFLRAVAHLGLSASDGTRLAERLTGRSFASCGPAELQPVIEQLLALVHRQHCPEPMESPRCGA